MSTTLVTKIGAIGNQANLTTDATGTPVGINNPVNNTPIASWNQSVNRIPTVNDNTSKGYATSSVWQAFGQLYNPVGTMDSTFAAWTANRTSPYGRFVDVVGSTNAIFAGGLIAMKSGYTGAACDVLVNGVTTTINILPNGELDNGALESALSGLVSGTYAYCTRLVDQSGNGNHAVVATGLPSPIIDWDEATGKYALKSWISSALNTNSMLQLPHGLLNASGSALTSGFGVRGNNFSAVTISRALNTLAGPIGYFAVGDYSAVDNNVGAWSSSVTYSAGQYVSNGFRSIAGSNLNNALPAAGADNAFWQYYPATFVTTQVNTNGSAWQVWSNNGDSHTGVADPVAPSQLSIMTIVSSNSGTTVRVNEKATTGTAQTTNYFANGFICAQRAQIGSQAYILGIGIANTAISATQEQTIRYSAYKDLNILPQVQDQVFILGDSRHAAAAPYKDKIWDSVGELMASYVGSSTTINNFAIGSATTALILQIQVPTVVNKFKANVKNTVYLLAGVNDFIVSNFTPAQALAGIQSIITPLKAAGYTVNLVNELVTTNTTNNTNTKLEALRALITAAGTGGMGCDTIIDLNQYSQLTNPGDPIYFPDGLHPSVVYWSIAAGIYAKYLQSSSVSLINTRPHFN